MTSTYDTKHIKIRAIQDHVIISDMDFGEIKTESGIVVRSDDGKAHGVKPRWAKVYKIGPNQKEIKVGQWILIEHGRWSRKIKIHDGETEKEIQRVDVKAILATSDDAPGINDVVVNKTEF